MSLYFQKMIFMMYISVREFAKRLGVSDRTIRNYCSSGKLEGAFLTGKTWNISEGAVVSTKSKVNRYSDNTLLNTLKEQKDMKMSGGIYHRTQIKLTYNSSHIEGGKLTKDQI